MAWGVVAPCAPPNRGGLPPENVPHVLRSGRAGQPGRPGERPGRGLPRRRVLLRQIAGRRDPLVSRGGGTGGAPPRPRHRARPRPRRGRRPGAHARETVAERRDQVAYDLRHRAALSAYGVPLDATALRGEQAALTTQDPAAIIERPYDGARLDAIRQRQRFVLPLCWLDNASGGPTRRAGRYGGGHRGPAPHGSAPHDAPAPRATAQGALGRGPGAAAPGCSTRHTRAARGCGSARRGRGGDRGTRGARCPGSARTPHAPAARERVCAGS